MSNRDLSNALVLPYLIGVHLQLKRYKRVAKLAERGNAYYLMLTTHELSNLLEDLDMKRVLFDKDNNNSVSETIKHMRDHIRHDARDNINDKKHGKRRIKLGIPENASVFIMPGYEYIQFGKLRLDLDDIKKYIKWVEDRVPEINNIMATKTNNKSNA